jgi:hypothetical protein
MRTGTASSRWPLIAAMVDATPAPAQMYVHRHAVQRGLGRIGT